MRNMLILGAGAGGSIVANMPCKELSESEWQITIIDRDERHHCQAGYLFIPLGVYGQQDVLKPKTVGNVQETVKSWGVTAAT